ncbi:MAG: hypothetical protein QF441_07475 [Bacteriovoracaceae bacterium]|jgi:hypothetical protein|nr:hypothetical protein [Bacteriovoracaceae bacterium]|tara:strand:+ start:84 stop:428 length:345 start_codon:yes stop_codon:yes gene_type:complete
MTKHNKDIPDDLIGFKDLIGEEEGQKTKKTKRNNEQSHLIASFLERESARLSKAINLCEDKVFSIKAYSQEKSLLDEQEGHNKKLKEELVKELTSSQSSLTKNLNEMLSVHFNS